MSSRCQFSSQHELGYVTKQAEQHSSVISSATCDSSEFRVLQEARLMLMCHQRSLLKTRIIRLSASTEVVLTDFRSHKGMAVKWTVWSRVASASICIWQVQTLYFTANVDFIQKIQKQFQLIFRITEFRLELPRNSTFCTCAWKWWTSKVPFLIHWSLHFYSFRAFNSINWIK